MRKAHQSHGGFGKGEKDPAQMAADGWYQRPNGSWVKGYGKTTTGSGKSVDLTPRVAAGIITGDGHDRERQRALYGKDLGYVPELSGKTVREKWPQSVPAGNGKFAPTNESLNTPAKRAGFMRLFPHFEEH